MAFQSTTGAEFFESQAACRFNFIAAADRRASEELDWSRRFIQAGFEFKSRRPRRAGLRRGYFRRHLP